jgi:hypothetical protein
MASEAKKTPGLALIFGEGKKPPAPKGEPDGDEAMMGDEAPTTEGDEPSEAYKTALAETGLGLDDEQAGALWRAIKECAGSY